MERILIIGNAGSGKTTFAKAITQKLNVPLVHLDKLFWCGKWHHISRDEFDKKLQIELENPRWVIDGNYNRTIPHRLKYCDTVFYFDLPVMTCLWGSTIRVFRNYGRSREDMGGYCPEYFDKHKFQLYLSIIKFNKENRKRYYQLLSEQKDKKVIIFRKRKDIKEFLRSL